MVVHEVSEQTDEQDDSRARSRDEDRDHREAAVVHRTEDETVQSERQEKEGPGDPGQDERADGECRGDEDEGECRGGVLGRGEAGEHEGGDGGGDEQGSGDGAPLPEVCPVHHLEGNHDGGRDHAEKERTGDLGLVLDETLHDSGECEHREQHSRSHREDESPVDGACVPPDVGSIGDEGLRERDEIVARVEGALVDADDEGDRSARDAGNEFREGDESAADHVEQDFADARTGACW